MAYDQLIGEVQQQPFMENTIMLAHGLSESYLKPVKDEQFKLFVQMFKKIRCNVVLTNFRLLFLPQFS